jgi:hypothetical protein
VFGSLVWCVLPTPLVTGAIYGRRDFQPLRLGALIPWLTLIVMRIPPITCCPNGDLLLAMGALRTLAAVMRAG